MSKPSTLSVKLQDRLIALFEPLGYQSSLNEGILQFKQDDQRVLFTTGTGHDLEWTVMSFPLIELDNPEAPSIISYMLFSNYMMLMSVEQTLYMSVNPESGEFEVSMTLMNEHIMSNDFPDSLKQVLENAKNWGNPSRALNTMLENAQSQLSELLSMAEDSSETDQPLVATKPGLNKGIPGQTNLFAPESDNLFAPKPMRSAVNSSLKKPAESDQDDGKPPSGWIPL